MEKAAPAVTQNPPVDTWRFQRIAIAGITGALCGVYVRAFNFWQVGTADVARELLDLFGLPLLFVTVAVLSLVWLIVAVIALFRRRWRRMTSSILAIVTIAVGFSMVAAVPLFDPWFWYVIINKSKFEATVLGKVSVDSKPFAVIDEWDISTGLAGVSANHFIALVYDGSDGTPPDPSNQYQTHVYGHFYLRDHYE